MWDALGDPGGYVEPFCGSAAVLLARPGADRPGWRRVETLNDADGWLCNTWRAIQHDPAGVAEHCWGPVSEIDYHARLAWLQERRTPELVAWLEGDPEICDVKAAGWWLYVMACGIGDPFGPGPWRVVDGKLTDTRNLGDDAGRGVNRELPHLGSAGRGVKRGLPHLGTAGQGVSRELPHLGTAGQGVNRELPHLGDAGRGRLVDYLTALAARLAHVRIVCGDWKRVMGTSVTRAGSGPAARAVFLDPPYGEGALNLYAYRGSNERTLISDVLAWCLSDDATGLRVVVAGYDGQYPALEDAGWTVLQGAATTGGGYASQGNKNAARERLWCSPQCVVAPSLFDGVPVL